jgi:hypothetical protein
MSLLAGLAGGLLKGIFGRSQPRGTDFVKLRDDALKAGFNPLTALGATGGAGYQTPALSSSSFIGDALAEGFDAWSNRESKETQAEYEKLRNEMMREEIDALRKANANPFNQVGFGYQPQAERGPGNIAMTEAPKLTVPSKNSDPVGVTPALSTSTDGLTRANPDAPAQPEEDLWAWMRDGTLFENVREAGRRNAAGFNKGVIDFFTWSFPRGHKWTAEEIEFFEQQHQKRLEEKRPSPPWLNPGHYDGPPTKQRWPREILNWE